MPYNIPRIAPEMIVQSMEGLSFANGGLTKKEIANYIGKSEEYARRALQVGTSFGWVKEDGKKYSAVGDCFKFSKADPKQKQILFRKGIQTFSPFILFVTLIIKGDLPKDAARKTKVIFDVSEPSEDILTSLLVWGEYSGTLTKNSDGTVVTDVGIKIDELSQEYIQHLLEALQSDLKMRVYLTNKLTPEAFAFLSSGEVGLITNALSAYARNPTHSVEDAGKALEDFLRSVAKASDLDVSNKSGIVEIINEFRGKKPDLISPKLSSVAEGLGMIRTMAAHSKDKKTEVPWTINPDAALEYCLIVVSVVRAIYFFFTKKIQQF